MTGQESANGPGESVRCCWAWASPEPTSPIDAEAFVTFVWGAKTPSREARTGRTVRGRLDRETCGRWS